jgi:hypothetical protein
VGFLLCNGETEYKREIFYSKKQISAFGSAGFSTVGISSVYEAKAMANTLLHEHGALSVSHCIPNGILFPIPM